MLAILTEFFGSLALIFGIFTRVAAFGIAVDMLVAVIVVHFPNGFFMNWFGSKQGEGFEYHILAIGIALALAFRGAGCCSLDRLLGAGTPPPPPPAS